MGAGGAKFSTILLREGEIHLFVSGAASLAIGSFRREVLHVRSSSSPVAPRLRGPERPVYQPRDQVFWHTALLDIELTNFLLTKIGVHEIYYNASGGTTCSSG